jgi:hypothetical protein
MVVINWLVVNMELVAVFKTFSPVEAQLIRSRLDAAGFLADVQGELSALTTEGYSLTTGGIKVVVPADQAEEARALLDAENESPGASPENQVR